MTAYPPPYQDLRTLCEHICVGESTIENWVKQGLFPAPFKIGGKRLWRWKEVENHLALVANGIGPSQPNELTERIRHATQQAASEPH